MPTVYEKARSRSGALGDNGPESFDLEFVVSGTDDEMQAVNLVLSKTTPTRLGFTKTLVRQPLKPKEVGYQLWHVNVPYITPETGGGGNDDDAQPLEYKVKWDTGGGTHKLVISKRVVSTSDFDNSEVIGWDGKKIHGVDIHVPQFRFSLEIFYPTGYLTFAQVANWARATGKMNSNTWFDFEPGELLFIGQTGEIAREVFTGLVTKPIPITFHFDASENRGPFDVRGIQKNLIVPGARGWDYLDVRFAEESLALGGGHTVTVPEPQSFKVHEIYDEINFAALTGIG